MRSKHAPTTSVISSLRSFGTAALVVLAPMACDSGDVEPDDEDLLVADAEDADGITQEIVDNLRQAGYPDGEIEVREDGTVLVGGDAVVGLEASREMIGVAGDGSESDDADQFRQYRTNNTVAGSVQVICIDGSGLAGDLSTALDNAIANFTNQNLKFDMVRTNGSDAGCDAEITAYVIPGTSGSAGFPSGGLPYGTINIGSAIPGTYGLAATTHVITHELGHCIGFRHSDYFDRSISCGGSAYNEGDAGIGAVHIPGTPVGAVYNGSIMNSCYNAGSTGQWTASDIAALIALYAPAPAAPNPLVKLSESCYGLFSMYWTGQPSATEYQLYGSTSSTFSSPFVLYAGTDTETAINVTSGTWYLRARACSAAGCSGWTNQVSATRVNYCL